MRNNWFWCHCGRRFLKFGLGYDDHIANGEHEARRKKQRAANANRSREQRLRDSAAQGIDTGQLG